MPSQVRPPPPNVHAPFIQEMGARLQRVGINANFFVQRNYLRCGLTDAILASLLRPLTDVTDDIKLERIMHIGINQRRFQTVRGMTDRQFYEFLTYIRTPDGQKEISALSATEKLQRRGKGIFNAEQMGWISMVDIMRSDMATDLGDIRQRHEGEIAELEMRLRNAKAAMEREIETAKQNYNPVASYEQLTHFVFNERCWDEYLMECQLMDIPPVELTHEAIVDAVNTHKDVVKQRHLLEFVDEGDNKTLVAEYINRRIGHFTNLREERPIKRFRGLLGAVGIEPAVQAPAGPPPEVAAPDAGRAPPPARPNHIFDAVIADPGQPAFEREEDLGEPAEAVTGPGDGEAPVPEQPARRSPPNTRSRVPTARGRPRHPAR